MSATDAAARQRTHYEQVLDEYERHYYDAPAMAFRERFVYAPMFAGLDLAGARVADLAAGSGHNSLALARAFPGCRTEGFDVSPSACRAYTKRVGQPAHELDLTAGAYEGPAFDAALVVGGLHHCVSDLDGTFRTLAAMLRPGGVLMMMEPNRRYLLEAARQLWYRVDPYFEAETEDALDHDAMLAGAGDAFRLRDVRYLGGPAFFLIFNSMIFRVPLAWKRWLAPPLHGFEAAYNRLPGRRPFPYFVARWERR